MNGNLKSLREQRALSLTDLAQIAGVNRVTINRIENGKQKPMPRTIRKLAEALRVSVEELRNTEGVSHAQ
jgi:transcriptional regulator with XRE-family HTH domain